MRISDPAQWRREKLLLVWQGWPSRAMRFAIRTSVLSASAWVGVAAFGKPINDSDVTVSLSAVLTACGQMRRALDAMEEAQTQKHDDMPQSDSGNTSPVRADNWTMDRHGTRWILDPGTNQWRRSP